MTVQTQQDIKKDPVQTQNIQEQPKTAQETNAPQIKTEENLDNWKKFREQREIERKEREELQKKANEKAAEAEALKAAMEAILNKNQHKNDQRQDRYNVQDENEETEEQRIDRRVEEALQKKQAQFERERNERDQKEYPQKLISAFGDFNQVCTTENLDYLEYHYPEVARAFKHVPDGFDKWADVYKAVKKFVPNTDHKKEVTKAAVNSNKPQSLSAQGLATTANQTPPRILDEKTRAANWERMQKVLKGLS